MHVSQISHEIIDVQDLDRVRSSYSEDGDKDASATSHASIPKPKKPIKPMKPGRKQSFPAHWGSPPSMQTKDLRSLPGGYGMGSSTLAGWIKKNIENDKPRSKPRPKFPAHWGEPPSIQTMDIRPLPAGYGMGSSSMFKWITKNLDTDGAEDNDDGDKDEPAVQMCCRMLGDVNGRTDFTVSNGLSWDDDGKLTLS